MFDRAIVILSVCLFIHNYGVGQNDIQSLGLLPSSIDETSGLILIGDNLVTHNDSGNRPELYVLDTTNLTIVRTVEINNVPNLDWEDLAQDNDFIYIGDFGNNSGDRQDLAVLKISKSDFLNNGSVNAERINFAYEDQTDFMTSEQTDWDAEALFVLNNSLIILTKQWVSNGTVAYRLPKEPGDHTAERLDEYQVNGLVTGADYSLSTNSLYLSGYSNFLTPFFAVVENVDESLIFQGTKNKTNLEIGFAQIESITRTLDGTFYCTSEEFNSSNPPITSASRLFRFHENSENEETMEPQEPNNEELVLFKPYGSNQLNFNLNTDQPIFGVGIFDVNGKRVWFSPPEFAPTNSIDISGLSPSIYFLGFKLRDGFLSKAFIKE
ncbi:T9SS type A sorting domain-containing protein [Croceivirga thetidis]|uniref:T9SS type A sorting domain-containing protein n=1 Tax=Croceivirga thetidis TaxID=2721623 RepID=A0ABX1GR19_9FLAO|nr:T9SS type A sorting domain-containing protein [Croceivirga thetidis]NKI32073.1 T9SS type A sorting domain-containing protein [Croceivirga thetidis]